MNFTQLDKIAQKLMKGRQAHIDRETGSVYYHGVRTARGVLILRKHITEDATHDDLLACAALFHDIGKGINPHGQYGALLIHEALRNVLCSEERSEVARLISFHEDKQGPSSKYDIWVRLLQDADLLDHIGTYEIWMACNYHAYRHEPMENMAQWYCAEFENEMKRLRTLLNYDVSRVIFDSKVDFERAFIQRYKVEVTGEYVLQEQKVD